MGRIDSVKERRAAPLSVIPGLESEERFEFVVGEVAGAGVKDSVCEFFCNELIALRKFSDMASGRNSTCANLFSI